jgi:DNA-binding FadR family transcriptional regulator
MAPELMLFFNHAAGHVVSAALIQAAMVAGDLHAAVPYGDVGERFGVSRTHVRKIVEEAQAAGLVRLHGRGGHRVEILPSLWTSYDRGLAVGMFIHDTVHAVTIGRQAGATPQTAALAAE